MRCMVTENERGNEIRKRPPEDHRVIREILRTKSAKKEAVDESLQPKVFTAVG